jgi:hypothetical protein
MPQPWPLRLKLVLEPAIQGGVSTDVPLSLAQSTSLDENWNKYPSNCMFVVKLLLYPVGLQILTRRQTKHPENGKPKRKPRLHEHTTFGRGKEFMPPLWSTGMGQRYHDLHYIFRLKRHKQTI